MSRNCPASSRRRTRCRICTGLWVPHRRGRSDQTVRASRRAGLRDDPLRLPRRATRPAAITCRSWTRPRAATASPCPTGSWPAPPPIPRRPAATSARWPPQPITARPTASSPPRRHARSFPDHGTELDLIHHMSHNLAKIETHRIGGIPTRLYVHRKEAARALPPGRPTSVPAWPIPDSRCSSPARWEHPPTSWRG